MSDPKTAAWIRQQIESARGLDASAAANQCVRLIDAANTLRGSAMGSVFGLTIRGCDVADSAQLADECLAVVDALLPKVNAKERELVESVLVSRGIRPAKAVTPWGIAEVTLDAEIQDYEECEPVTDPKDWARWNGVHEEREALLCDVLGLDWILSSTCHLRVMDRVDAVMTFSLSRAPTEAELVELRNKVDAALFSGWGLNTEFVPLTDDDDLTHAATVKQTTSVRAVATKR